MPCPLPGWPTGPHHLTGWAGFWNDLPPDRYLRDGGRYRRRRHGCFVVEGDRVDAVPHRAHWQPVEYNALHGGIERWFEPLPRRWCPTRLAAAAAPRWPVWPRVKHAACPLVVEAHVFRIDTTDGIGRPTPEGAHRDGVDLVAVFLLGRA
jgi:hypothetical protein